MLLTSKRGQVIRLSLKQVPILGRATQGVYLMRLNEGDSVSAVAFMEEGEEPEILPPKEEEKRE